MLNAVPASLLEAVRFQLLHHLPLPLLLFTRATSSICATTTDTADDMPDRPRRPRFRSPWSAASWVTISTTVLALLSLLVTTHSFVWRQIDTKGCRMSYMRPAFAKLEDFDTEHTRFASKYSVYLYREQGVDEDTKVRRDGRRSRRSANSTYRSKVFLSYLYLEMLEAISRYDQLQLRLQYIFTMSYSMIPPFLKRVQEPWISSRLISMKNLLPFMDRLSLIKPNISTKLLHTYYRYTTILEGRKEIQIYRIQHL